MSKACIRIATGRSPIVGSNHRNPHLSIKHIYSESTAAAPSPDFSAKRRRRRRRSKIKMGIWACLGVISPFPFYYFLWNNPQSWVDLCGRGRDPCRVMALVSHFLKLAQFIALFSVSTFRVYQLLGESGTYYGIRFGKNIPWVTEFPFGVISDPQYIGSIMSLLACLHWVPFLYIILWVLGYMFMMKVESKEDPSTRAKPLS
ncbi:phosphatidyl-N-methylethanolamine N-methyltransferase [Sesamum indicum]|uniref:phosphatidyl-N-methylethanolamine N-methyltransferase n=1 Tax=Sesamum indicum TaxID=4182 RepID=A0A8M8V2A7_SESIN|nr:phosphatidyl-N-methylethanolamine N-methyltransferase [Sesamum indicum]